jgi:hypothetical protein
MNVISNWACILWSGMHVRNVVAKSQGFTLLYKPIHNRDIRKVRKRQHQYPEFGHTQGEIKKKPAKKYIRIDGF